jgi:murein DD-endopeptidase MepM/ murein hydrolase activator NlpD
MASKTYTRLKEWLEHVFPERHIYVLTFGETKGHVLSTGKQIFLAFLFTVLMFWLAFSTGMSVLMATAIGPSNENRLLMERAQSERHIADRQARLDQAVRHLNESTGSLEELAKTVEKRHNALADVLKDFKGVPGARVALSPIPLNKSLSPVEQIYSVRAEQERMLVRAESLAKSRAERLRLAFRMAGLDPRAYASGQGGPYAGSRDTKELSVMLGVDEDFAKRIRNASSDLNDMLSLQSYSERIPFHPPSRGSRMTSGFGFRFDPFTRAPRFHQGQDFAAPYLTPIISTAPGIVSFAGVRGGYGNTVEIDHGGGFMTRYAHMAAIAVSRGQRIGVGQRVGSMGSTGRSTGVHLHYEVWLNGRSQNPARYLKAGDYVQQS